MNDELKERIASAQGFPGALAKSMHIRLDVHSFR